MNKFDFLAKSFIRLILALVAILAALTITLSIILSNYTKIWTSIIFLLASAIILFIILLVNKRLEKKYLFSITDIKNKIEEMLEDEFCTKYNTYLISCTLKEMAFCIDIKDEDIELKYLKSVVDELLSNLNKSDALVKINIYLNLTN